MGAIATALALRQGRVAAQGAPALAIPELDELAIRVIVDNRRQVVDQPLHVGGVEVEPFTPPQSESSPARSLMREWGASMLFETRRGNEVRQILVDFGATSPTFLNNIALLGLRPEALDALVLTHSHLDHFGGLERFLEVSRGRLRPGIPFVLGSEAAFCLRGGRAPSRAALREAGLEIVFSERPVIVAGHVFTTGSIDRTSFERVTGGTSMTVGVADAGRPGNASELGCRPELMPEGAGGTGATPDDLSHEIAPCAMIRGRGLVVFAGCGHRGVVNTLRRAMAVAGGARIHAVMGGFHLSQEGEDYVRQTVAELKRLDPDVILPMHCTGDRFDAIAKEEMPGKLVAVSTGTRVIFRA